MAHRSQSRKPKKVKVRPIRKRPKTTHEATSGPRSTKCYLTSFPHDLRAKIYAELFEGSQILPTMPWNGTRDDVLVYAFAIKKSCGLLLSCRMIYNEATPILARYSTLVLSLLPQLSWLPGSLRTVHLRHIQQLELRTINVRFRQEDFPSLKKLSIAGCEVMEVWVKSQKLADMVSYLIGDKDVSYIDQWVVKYESLAETATELRPLEYRRFGNRWRSLRSLDMSVEVLTNACVIVRPARGREVRLVCYETESYRSED